MSKSSKKSKVLEVISITYKSNEKIHTMKPFKDIEAKGLVGSVGTNIVCKPGQTRCVNGHLQFCVIWQGDPTWMESDESCE